MKGGRYIGWTTHPPTSLPSHLRISAKGQGTAVVFLEARRQLHLAEATVGGAVRRGHSTAPEKQEVLEGGQRGRGGRKRRSGWRYRRGRGGRDSRRRKGGGDCSRCCCYCRCHCLRGLRCLLHRHGRNRYRCRTRTRRRRCRRRHRALGDTGDDAGAVAGKELQRLMNIRPVARLEPASVDIENEPRAVGLARSRAPAALLRPAQVAAVGGRARRARVDVKPANVLARMHSEARAHGRYSRDSSGARRRRSRGWHNTRDGRPRVPGPGQRPPVRANVPRADDGHAGAAALEKAREFGRAVLCALCSGGVKVRPGSGVAVEVRRGWGRRRGDEEEAHVHADGEGHEALEETAHGARYRHLKIAALNKPARPYCKHPNQRTPIQMRSVFRA